MKNGVTYEKMGIFASGLRLEKVFPVFSDISLPP